LQIEADGSRVFSFGEASRRKVVGPAVVVSVQAMLRVVALPLQKLRELQAGVRVVTSDA
jgi:hypothetical protein